MALRLVAVALVMLLRVCGGEAQQDGESENYGRTAAGIEKCGFVGERHEVTTKDGYRTAAFRMLQSSGSPGVQPVVLQHGFLASSDSWFQLEASSLPCLLATAGYDVWLPNSRGNSYSKAHTTFGTETLQFWAFSFHEMAVYDLSATIDYVRSAASAEKVHYVGHSTGGTLMLALLSVLPEYNHKVSVAVSFAPICFMGHTTSHLLKLLAYAAPYFEKPLNWMTNGEIPPFPDPQATKGDVFDFHIGAALGEVIDFRQMLQREMVLDAEAGGFLTEGTSLRTVLHIAQLITHGNFSWYDFGKRNTVEYKRQTPPNYNLRRISATQIIMYSDADYLVVAKDARHLCSELPEGVGLCYRVNKTGFGHADFLSSYDAQEYVYNVLFGDLDKESGETQGKAAAPQVRGKAAAVPEEDWPPAADDETAAVSSEERPAVPPARGRPTIFPGRGRTTGSAMRFRAPKSPEEQPAAAPPSRAGVPERESEEEAAPKPPEWGTAEASPREEVVRRQAVSSAPGRAGPSSARGRPSTAQAQARGRIASRVRGMAAAPPERPEAAAAAAVAALPEGQLAAAAAAPARSNSPSARARPATTTSALRPRAAASEEEHDPSAPVKVCRYYATAGRLQRICYEEYA